MRILIISNIPPYVKGGAETQARMLAEEFTRQGHQVVILGQSVEESVLDVAGRIIPVRRLRIVQKTKWLRAVSYILTLMAYILVNKRQFDVVYCRFIREATLTISFIKFLFRLDLPLIGCTACAGKMGDAEFISKLPFSTFVISVLNGHCNFINNISPATANEFRSLGVHSSSLKYIPNGIRLSGIEPKNYVNKKRQIVYMGRLTSQKGLTFLLHAFRLVLDHEIQCGLHLIGEGPELKSLQSLCKELKITDHVRFHGHIENSLIVNTLKSFDIMVMPSLYEGFCTAVIEAMYAGLPVLVTRSGGPEYFVDAELGRVCDPASAEQLMSNILELVQMNDAKILSLGMAGRIKVERNFDISIIAKQYLNLFQSSI